MKPNLRFFLVAGEPSGDLHGNALMYALKERVPSIYFEGVGGPLMRQQGIHCVQQMEDFEVMGFLDILRHLPKLWRQFNKIRDNILKSQPDVLICIDYPGFNLRLAKALRRKGFKGKIVQYISPTVWAWGRERIETMEQSLDLLLTIFPFEAAYFASSPLKVTYVGHPIQEMIHQHHYDEQWKDKTGISFHDHLIALFAGSRKHELRNHLPAMLQAGRKLRQDNPDVRLALSYMRQEDLPWMEEMIEKSDLILNEDIYLIPSHYRYELMRDSHSAIAKSGTVTLELGLHHRPTVVIYAVNTFNYLIAKYWLKLSLPFYCIVNILAQHEVFPELIEQKFESDDIFRKIRELDQNNDKREMCIKGCEEVSILLGHQKAHERAAKAVLELLS